MKTRHKLVLPDLDMEDLPVTASVWLVRLGSEVIEGDRILEISAGEVTIDLPAPADGVLVEKRVGEEEPLRPGQVLGVVESSG